MDQEAEIQVAIWQKIFQAQLLWTAEIENRLGVTIPLETNRSLISINDALAAEMAIEEMLQGVHK
jgi:hypothetical protein